MTKSTQPTTPDQMDELEASRTVEGAQEFVFDLPQPDAGRAALLIFSVTPEGSTRLLTHLPLSLGDRVGECAAITSFPLSETQDCGD